MYKQTASQVMEGLKTSKNGLSQHEADERLKINGKNELKKVKKQSFIKCFFKQFLNIMVGILLVSAVVSITIDDEFVVHDIKVIEGEKGLFIAMPSRKANDGEYRDIAHPINSTTRDNIQRLILEKYKAEIENAE